MGTSIARSRSSRGPGVPTSRAAASRRCRPPTTSRGSRGPRRPSGSRRGMLPRQPLVRDQEAGGHLGEVIRCDAGGAHGANQQSAGVERRRCQRVSARPPHFGHSRQRLEPRRREHPAERVRLRRQHAGRGHRRQALRLAVEERVDRVAQAVGIDRVRVELADRPAELLGQARHARGPREPAPGTGEHVFPDRWQIERRQHRADVAEGLVQRGHLDARRVPELRPDRIEQRVPEFVAEHVGALSGVHRDATHRRMEKAQFLAVVVRVQIFARVEIDDERPPAVPPGGAGHDAAPEPHGTGQRVGGVPGTRKPCVPAG